MSNIILDVYKVIPIIMNILKYRSSVFFAIRLLFSAVFVMIYKTKPIDIYSIFTLILVWISNFNRWIVAVS